MEKSISSSSFKNLDELPIVLNVSDVSKALGLSLSNTYVLFNRGDFPSFRLGKRRKISKEQFIIWLNQKAENQ